MGAEQDEPIRLMEDEETGDRLLVYSTDKGLRIDIRFEGESLWMTQAQIGQLFGRDVSTVSRHIGNILDDGELDGSGSLQKVQTTNGRPATIYSLDMVISVGYLRQVQGHPPRYCIAAAPALPPCPPLARGRADRPVNLSGCRALVLWRRRSGSATRPQIWPSDG